MQPEDRASRRIARRMSGKYLEDRRKRRERKLARKLRLVPSRRSNPPNITLLSRDDLDRFGPDERDQAR
jgi:hypothetical protein